MTAYRRREETLNTQLAFLLSRFGVKADAETIQASGRARPDVLFNWRSLRVVIKGKFADWACGAGTLLMTAQAVSSACILAREPGLTGKSALD